MLGHQDPLDLPEPLAQQVQLAQLDPLDLMAPNNLLQLVVIHLVILGAVDRLIKWYVLHDSVILMIQHSQISVQIVNI